MLIGTYDRNIQSILSESQITSVAHTREMLSKQISAILQSLTDVNGSLAEHVAAKEMLEKWIEEDKNATNKLDVAEGEAGTPDSPAADRTDYQALLSRIDNMRAQEAQYLVHFTESMPLVRNLRDQIEELERQRDAQFPGFEETGAAGPAVGSIAGIEATGLPSQTAAPGRMTFNLRQETAWIASLEAKTNALHGDLEKFREQLRRLDAVEQRILVFQNQKEEAQEKFRYFSRRAAKASSSATGTGADSSNISILQHASYPNEVAGGSKMAAAFLVLVFGGVAGFFAVWDLVLRNTVNRPEDVESKLELPLFMPIPEIGDARPLRERIEKGLRLLKEPSAWKSRVLQLWRPALDEGRLQKALRRYCQDLRDNIIGHFAIAGDTSKPKLVAITSSCPGAGASTLSAGLARALSEAGTGKVLLVDLSGMVDKEGGPVTDMNWRGLRDLMKDRDGDDSGPFVPSAGDDNLECATAFLTREEANGNGAPVVGGAPRTGAGDEAAGVGNGTDASMKGTSLPSVIHSLLPKFSGSDYDYVIFDMPPISHSSITSRLVGLMNHTLVVVPARGVSLQTLRMHKRMLERVRADTSVVLNRCKTFVPWQS